MSEFDRRDFLKLAGIGGVVFAPDARGALKKAIAAVNSLEERPDFVVFTGDLTHTTDDPKVRRAITELPITKG